MKIKINYNEDETTEKISLDVTPEKEKRCEKVVDVLIKVLINIILDNEISIRWFVRLIKKYYKDMKKSRKNGK